MGAAHRGPARHGVGRRRLARRRLVDVLLDFGRLGEDGVTPRPEALDLVHTLDARGILQTVASKNDHDVAWAKVDVPM